MKVFIYVLLDPLTKEVRYVGKTINSRQRLRKHLTRRENNHKHSWVKSLRTKGLKPIMAIIEELEVEADEQWQPAEQWWIERLRNAGCQLTNLNDGGKGGIRPSEETRARMRAAHLGKAMPTETRAKISNAHKGVAKSVSTRLKFSRRMIGWKPDAATRQKMAENARRLMTPERTAILKAASSTPEARAKMAAALTGKKQSPETKLKRAASLKAFRERLARRPPPLKACSSMRSMENGGNAKRT